MIYALYYIIGSFLVLAAFAIFGLLGRPRQKAQPLEVYEKKIFGGGEERGDIGWNT